MSCSEKAMEYFNMGYNCAQATFAGCNSVTGMDNEAAFAVSGAFGGGMRMGGTCGAVTGGLMALGCVFPFTDSAKTQDKDRIGNLTVEFLSRFKSEFLCLDCDCLVKGDKALARTTVCPAAVQGAARIVEEMAKEYK